MINDQNIDVRPNGLDYIYQQLRERKLADTRIIISVLIQHKKAASQRAMIARLACRTNFKTHIFASSRAELREKISATASDTTKLCLHLKYNALSSELVFVMHHETHDGIECMRIICEAIGFKNRLPRFNNNKFNYKFVTAAALTSLLRLRLHKQLHNPKQHAQIHCVLNAKSLQHRKNKLSLADALLLHIIECLQASLKQQPKTLTVGKILSLPVNGNNSFTIKVARIKLVAKKLELQLKNNFNPRTAAGLNKLFTLSKFLPFYCTRKIVEIISTKIDVMYSFVPLIGIHSNDTHKIEVTSPGQANALFIYAIKQGANINTSISINSNTVDYTNFQKLLTSNAGN